MSSDHTTHIHNLKTGTHTNLNGTNISTDFVVGSTQLDFIDTDRSNRMMFDKSKGSFYAGSTSDTQWDSANRGQYAAAFGRNCTASGQYSVAMGYHSVAENGNAFAFGNSNNVSGTNSVAMGANNIISGNASFAVGIGNTSSGLRSSSIGDGNNATGDYSLAFGYGNTSSGDSSNTMGYANTASGFYSVAIGLDNQSGNYSAAIGDTNIASADYSYSVGSENISGGQYSVTIGNLNTSNGLNSMAFGKGAKIGAGTDGSFVWRSSLSTDSATEHGKDGSAHFICGSGTSSEFRISFGSVSTTPVISSATGYAWSSSSDINLKENLVEHNYSDTLDRIMDMPIYTYNFKSVASGIKSIGPVAQDFNRLFPSDKDPLSIVDRDMCGVALAGIRGINMKLNDALARISALETELAALKN